MLASLLTGHVCRMPLRALSRSLSMPLFIQCHCGQPILLLWNISQQVCCKLQNLPTHSSPFLFAPFCSFHSFLSLTVMWIFSLPVFVLLSLTSFHLLIPPLSSTPFSSWSTAIRLHLLFISRFLSSLLLAQTLTSLCFVSFAQKIVFSQDQSNCLKLVEF